LKTSRIILIGIIIVASIASLVMGLNYMKGNNFFVEENSYFVTYEEISGLQVSNSVLINGFKVGQVQEIKLLLDKGGIILVKLNINQDIHLTDSTVAMIYSLDLMGSKGISLNIGKGKELAVGDTLISAIEENLKDQVSAQMLPLKIKAEDLMLNMDDAIGMIKNIFSKTNTDNIKETLKNLNKTFSTLRHTSVELDSILTNNRGKLNQIFANVSSITNNLKNNNDQINFILKNLSAVSDSLAKSELLSTINRANSTLAQTDSIMRRINNGEGTIGQLINNDTLYQNLENASNSLDLLLIDIKENPKRYIHYSLFDFGKTIVVNNKNNIKNKKSKKNKNKDLSYFIQIKSAKKRIPFNSRELKNVRNIKEHYINGYYKYSIGSSSNYTEIKELRRKVLQIFPDAFITRYDNDSIVKQSY